MYRGKNNRERAAPCGSAKAREPNPNGKRHGTRVFCQVFRLRGEPKILKPQDPVHHTEIPCSTTPIIICSNQIITKVQKKVNEKNGTIAPPTEPNPEPNPDRRTDHRATAPRRAETAAAFFQGGWWGCAVFAARDAGARQFWFCLFSAVCLSLWYPAPIGPQAACGNRRTGGGNYGIA